MHPKRFMLLTALLLNVLVCDLVMPQPVYAASVRYAVMNGSTTTSCLSWAEACTLQRALSIASSGDQIWVKKGTYTPGALGADRAVTFTLRNGVTLYGGFPESGGDLSNRNWTANQTILSGDLNGNGLDSSDAYHVVTADGTNSSAVLDGFTITGGNANVNTSSNFSGAGILVGNGSPTLANLVISANSAGGLGGGMYLYETSLSLNNVTFSSNTAHMYGGAIYVFKGNLSLTNATFDSNTAVDGGDGGAIYLSSGSSSTLSNVIFRGNTAISLCAGNTCAGGSGGGMYLSYSNSTLSNVVFSGNTAGGSSGAMDLEHSSPTLTNVTFSSNSAPYGGGAIFMNASSPRYAIASFGEIQAETVYQVRS